MRGEARRLPPGPRVVMVAASLCRRSELGHARSCSCRRLSSRARVITARLPWSIEPSWAAKLKTVLESPSFARLKSFVDAEREKGPVWPLSENTFAAFHATPFDRVKVVLLGQDPYPSPGHAMGLSFSVAPDIRPPPSLRNIFEELKNDVGVSPPNHGDLSAWAHQGVLLLNSCLTVRSGEPNSHAGRGWEELTDEAVRALSSDREGIVFLMWGRDAQK